MSLLLPRLFARRTPSPATFFSRPSLLVPVLPTPSCSRRSYSDEAPEGEKKKKSPWIKRGDIVPKAPEFTSSQWADISNDILSQLPERVLGQHHRREIPEPKSPIVDVNTFLYHIGRGLNEKVKAKLPELTWKELFTYKGSDWGTEGGLDVKERKYLLWCVEKYRQGWDPRQFKTIPKKPKKYRRHGLAVQNGIRMRWSNKLDIGHAPRPWGMKAVVKVKRE